MGRRVGALVQQSDGRQVAAAQTVLASSGVPVVQVKLTLPQVGLAAEGTEKEEKREREEEEEEKK